MVFERRWPTVILTPIQVIDSYIIQVSDIKGLHTKQIIQLTNGALRSLFEIKCILPPNQLKVGLKEYGLTTYSDVSAFNGGTLAMYEQERNKIDGNIIARAVYEEEPVVAIRTVLVDPYGDYSDPYTAIQKALIPKTPTIQNIPFNSNATIPIALPQKVLNYTIKIRDSVSAFNISYDNINFIKVSRGNMYETGLIDCRAGLTLYITPTSSNGVFEILFLEL